MRSKSGVIAPQILEKFGDDILHRSGDELLFRCPFCEDRGKSPDLKGNLYVNNRKLVYFCQRCGASGRLIEDVKGYNFDETPSDIELLEKIDSILHNQDEVKCNFDLSNSSRIVFSNDSRTYYEDEAIRYLESRGITEDIIDFYEIRLGDIFSKKYKYRIVIPNRVEVRGGKEYTDMFVARYFREIPRDETGKLTIPKYVNPSGDNRSKTVFNLHRIEDGSPIIITEGVLSSISAGRNAVATYGKYVSRDQLIKILKKNPSVVYVSLDPDAIVEALELCKRIRSMSHVEVRVVELPDGEDPNSLGHDRFIEYLMKASIYNPVNKLIMSLVG